MTGASLLQWLFAGAPSDIELLRPRRAVPRASWLLLALGLALLAVSLARTLAPWERHAQLLAERAALEAELDHALGAPATRPLLHRSTGSEREVRAQAQALVHELRRPWRELFDRLEASMTPGVHIVQLSVDPRFESLQVTAESAEFPAIVRYTQRLTAAAPVRGVSMTHHEWRDAPGARVVDASMTAQLETPAGAGAESR